MEKKDFAKEFKLDDIRVSPGPLRITKNPKWYKRLWFLISNPFLYVFAGRVRWI